MDLLTDSQLRIINEFRERVRQSEKRLRETLDSKAMKENTMNSQAQDIGLNSQEVSKISDLKLDKSDGFNNTRDSFKKTDGVSLGDTIPQKLLKPIVFNGNLHNRSLISLRKSRRHGSNQQNPRSLPKQIRISS